MDKQKELEKIAQRIAQCRKCSLWKTRKNPVPGEGNPEAEVFLSGEGPGFWEDQKGRPFVGAAGRLLDELLGSINFKRNDVFISNVLHCRPPNNRDPEKREIEACKDYLFQQIKIIKPKIVVTLGRFSMALFIPKGKITKIHGQARWVDFENLKFVVVPMFHPAAALRNGKIMEEIKRGFQKIPTILGSLINQSAYSPINRTGEKVRQLELC